MSCTTPVPEPDALPGRPADREDKRSFLQKLAEFIHPGPDSRDELIETLADAEDNQIIGADARVMLERVIRMADMTAGDVMMAAPRMDVLNIDDPVPQLLDQVINTAHSRFPVYQGERDNIIGTLMAFLLDRTDLPGRGALRLLLLTPLFIPPFIGAIAWSGLLTDGGWRIFSKTGKGIK
jgi:magnesium and cobalt transporter